MGSTPEICSVDAPKSAKQYIRPRRAIASRALVFGSPAPNGSVVCSWLSFQLCSPQVPLVSPRQQQLHRPLSTAIGVWSFSSQLSPFYHSLSFIFIHITLYLCEQLHSFTSVASYVSLMSPTANSSIGIFPLFLCNSLFFPFSANISL